MLKSEEVIAVLVTSLHGFLINLLHIRGYIILINFWHEWYTTIATSLQVSTNHHSRTADPREEMNISISHKAEWDAFLSWFCLLHTRLNMGS